MADIIDENGTWIAGNDTLVQTGDMVDRGERFPQDHQRPTLTRENKGRIR